MSLKVIHVFFIMASIVLSAFYGAWQIDIAARSGAVLDWLLGLVSVLAGLALVFYLVWFIRKMKSIRI